MKYQVGDTVLLLHSGEEGKVVELLDKKMVMVDVGGVCIPVYMDQIDFPYFRRFTEKSKKPAPKTFIEDVRKEKPAPRKKTGDGVLLHLVPIYQKDIFDDDVVQYLKIYLINQYDSGYSFEFSLTCGSDSVFTHKGVLHAFADMYLCDLDFSRVSEQPSFAWTFAPEKTDAAKAPFFECSLKLRGKQLFKRIEEMQQRNESLVAYEVFRFYPGRVAEKGPDLSALKAAGYRVFDSERLDRDVVPPRSVVDLHWDKLTHPPVGLSAQGMLDFQLHVAESYLDRALAHRLDKIIFIHGIGNGTLKQELHDWLKTRSEVSSFVNQHHPQFGYGSTEVYLSR